MGQFKGCTGEMRYRMWVNTLQVGAENQEVCDNIVITNDLALTLVHLGLIDLEPNTYWQLVHPLAYKFYRGKI